MRATYVAFSESVIGPQPIEASLEILRTSNERYGLVVTSDLIVLAFRKPTDILWPSVNDLDKHNLGIRSRLENPSITERSST